MKTLVQKIFIIAYSLLALEARAQMPLLSSFPSARATVYLDFDGQFVQGTIWNRSGSINALPSGLSPESISEIFYQVAENFRPFNLNITTDSNIYNKAPLLQRIRVIFTTTSSWFGNNSGAACVGSFTWGDCTPAWVFNALLDNNPRYIARAASHEIGHTLGLQHQSIYDEDCKKISEYNGGEGKGEAGWAPIMGVSYYKAQETWITGKSSLGCEIVQRDVETIAGSPNNLGFRELQPRQNPTIALTGYNHNDLHLLTWNISITDTGQHIQVESTIDSTHFLPIATLPATAHSFCWRPFPGVYNRYRIKIVMENGQAINYSNTVILNSEVAEKNVQLLNSLVSNLLTINSKGTFEFQILDAGGRILASGELHAGRNTIDLSRAARGMLLLRWQDAILHGTEKLIKQ